MSIVHRLLSKLADDLDAGISRSSYEWSWSVSILHRLPPTPSVSKPPTGIISWQLFFRTPARTVVTGATRTPKNAPS